MRLRGFRIQRFKGIQDAIVPLGTLGGNIFTLIGLNESGKTTILEAISRFALDGNAAAALLPGAAAVQIPQLDPEEVATFVPKSEKYDFNSEITITASLEFDEREREKVIRETEEETGVKIRNTSVPTKFFLHRGYEFEDGDYKSYIHTLDIALEIKRLGERRYSECSDGSREWSIFTQKILRSLPQILYFPTFLFDQPGRVYLTEHPHETVRNRLYRKVIENFGGSLQRPIDIQKLIVERALAGGSAKGKLVSIDSLPDNKRQQIAAATADLSAQMTKTIFDAWSRTFGGDFSDRQIVLRVNVDNDTDTPMVYVQFEIREGGSHYELNEMSLGFRWFFSFILFTLFSSSARNDSATLFLLDEPASNLHSRAQMQLLETFPKIATGRNQIVYSTHSHYMINPEWLDQAFIVSNSAVDYKSEHEAGPRRSGGTNVQVERYRTFVGNNPDNVTSFQPVLDRLDVVPSKLDLIKPSVLVEGAGDYRIIEYVRRVIMASDAGYAVVPTRGAAGMDELIGLFLGWGVPFVVCLDDDREGRAARGRYIERWGLSEDGVFTLASVHRSLIGKSVEGLLEPSDIRLVADHFNIVGRPTKKQIQTYFGEMLATRKIVSISEELTSRVRMLDSIVCHSLSA